MAKKEVYKVKPMTEGKRNYHSRVTERVRHTHSRRYSGSVKRPAGRNNTGNA